jgi:hypothetical protein
MQGFSGVCASLNDTRRTLSLACLQNRGVDLWII